MGPTSALSSPLLLSGALDQYAAESLKEQLLASAPTPAAAPLLDMTAVEHIDGCALQVLLAWSEGLKPAKVRIHGAAPPIQQWIRIAGVCDLFEFSDTNN